MASSGAASAVGDLLAQTIVGNTYDPRRTLVFAAIGVFYFAPLLHLWYKALHKLEKSRAPSVFTECTVVGRGLAMHPCHQFFVLPIAYDAQVTLRGDAHDEDAIGIM